MGKKSKKSYGISYDTAVLFSAPHPGIYTHASWLLTTGQTKFSCNAIREAAEQIFPNLVDKRGFKGWVNEHIRQFAIAFNKHPWWQRSTSPLNRSKRVNALHYMSKLCIK